MKVEIQTVNGHYRGELVDKGSVPQELYSALIKADMSHGVFLRNVEHVGVGVFDVMAIRKEHIVSMAPALDRPIQTVTTTRPKPVG